MKSVYIFFMFVLCSVVWSSTVAVYNFEEGSNGSGGAYVVGLNHTVDDTVGSNDASVGLATSVGPKYITAHANSGSSLSMQFGPQDESLYIANNAVWNFGSAKTIEMYVRIDGKTLDPSDLQIIFAKDYTVNNGYICYWDESDDSVNFTIGSLTLSGSSDIGFLDGAWHHIAVTSDNQGSYNLYVDHNLDVSGSGSTGYVSSGYVTIGSGYGWMEARGLNGSVDDIKISDTVLSSGSFQSLPVLPVACYNFEKGSDGSGSTGLAPTTSDHIDNISGSYDGTVTTSTAGGPAYTTYTAKDFSSLSMEFSSGNDEIQVANSAIWNFGCTKTIEFFMKVDGASADSSTANYMICKDYTTSNGYSICWDESTRGVVLNIGGNVISGSTVVDDDMWHHVAVTSDNSGNYKLYVDYVLEGSCSGSTGYVSSGYVAIGTGFGWQYQRSFYGVLDDIRVYDSVLTPENFQPIDSDDSLLAYYRFEAGDDDYVPGDGDVVREYNSPSNSDDFGTFNNPDDGIKYTEDVFSWIDGRAAVEFGSTDDYISLPHSPVTAFSGAKTIEFFLRVDGASSDSSVKNFILSKCFPSSGGYELYWDDSTGLLSFSISSGVITSSRRINDGYWHQVAVTSDGAGTWKLYVDYRCHGILENAQTGTTDTQPLYIGTGYSWQNLRYFIGAIDELRISRSVLDVEDFAGIPTGYAALVDDYETLKSLANQLEASDELDVYAVMRIALIDKFLDYYIDDLVDQVSDLPTYAYSDLGDLIDEETARLQGIIADTYSTVDSPRRVVSQMPEPVGTYLQQQVEWTDGSKETRPVFLYGFCAEQQNFRADAEFIGSDLGCNYLQLFTGPKYVMPQESLWDAADPSQSSLDSGIMWHYRSAVSDANDYGIVTDMNISPHWIQDWFITNNPSYYADLGGFMKYTLNQADVKEIIGWTSRLMIEDLSTVDGLWSCCVLNEPCYFNWNADLDTSDLWVDYLQDFYNNSLSAANSNWNKSYSTWSSITKYLYPPSTPFASYPELYDWMKFNDNRISDWAVWLQTYIKAANSSLYTHIKQNERFYSQFNVMQGSDIDLLSRVTDLPGTDVALAPWDTSSSESVQRHGACGTLSLSLQKNLSQKAVINSENHVIYDNNTDSVDSGQVRSALWLQALSGMDATAAWIWGRDRGNMSSDLLGLWMNRPGATEEYARTGMDLMRLMPQIVEFREKDAKVAVLYSRTSALRYPDYSDYVLDTFQAMNQTGIQTVACTEQMVADNELLTKIPDLSVIILPGCVYLPDEVYSQIVSLSSSYDIKIIGVGSNIASKEEYCFDRSNPFSTVSSNYQSFSYFTFSGLWSSLSNTLCDLNIAPDITLTDTSGAPLSGLFYKSVEVDSIWYLTAVNMSTSSCTFKAKDVALRNWMMNDELNLVPDSSSYTMTLAPLEVGYYRLSASTPDVENYYNFEEGTDTLGSAGTAISTSGWIEDLVGSLDGTVTLASGKPEYITGLDSYTLAMKFGNANNAITFANSASFQWAESEDKTIEFFIRRDGDGPDQSSTEFVMSKGYTSSGGWQVTFDRSAGTLKFNIQGQIAESTTDFTDQQWHHVAIRHSADSGTYELFVDYAEEDELTGFTSGSSSMPDFLVGRGYGWQNLRVFNGAIDNIRISGQALGTTEFLD
ncbi:MAG: LamG-like jellyroll fold domain-containing protein [Sedimentisphaeraceae bacterium JB056]